VSELIPYSEYKSSGIEWIGDIPSSWSVQPLFSIARENRRSNKGMIENNLLSLSYGRIITKDITTNEGLLPASFETYQIVEPNDIVFRLTDLQNDKRSLRSALVSNRGIITSAYLSVKPIGVNPRYFAYAMRDADLRKVFYSMGGGLRQSMKYDDMKWLQVTCPPMSEQQNIANYLDEETKDIEAFIADQEELIGLLMERRMATISWVTSKGPTDSSTSPVRPLKESAVLQTGITLGKSYDEAQDYPYLRVANVQAGHVNTTDVKLVSVPASIAHSSMLEKGDVLMTEGGDRDKLGRGAIWHGEISPCLHQNHVFAVRCDPTRLLSKYLVYVLDSRHARDYFDLTAKQTTNLASTNSTTVKNFRFPLPSTEKQKQIVDFLDRETNEIDATITDAREAIELSRERRAALISAAVTGKIDLRDWSGSKERALESHGVA
jgi:type I restriction enzyme S subunit